MLLHPSGQFWAVENEAALEEFVWNSLVDLLKLQPLAKQYSEDGQICDILATAKDGQLVIIELKNTEDRYIVQQLTRYYNAIRESQPFSERIDYHKPVRLIAIAPRYHKDTITDCKYTTLQIELLTFEITKKQTDFFFSLKDREDQLVTTVLMTSARIQTDSDIPDPPRKLLNMLKHEDEANHELILQIRRQLLGADSRMEETTNSSSILYGKGKKFCAEFRMMMRSGKSNGIQLFLWLPYADNKKKIERMWIRTYSKWTEVYHFGNYPRAFKRPQVGDRTWYAPHFIEHMKGLGYNHSLEAYKPLLDRPSDDWVKPEAYVDLAIATWQKQLAL